MASQIDVDYSLAGIISLQQIIIITIKHQPSLYLIIELVIIEQEYNVHSFIKIRFDHSLPTKSIALIWLKEMYVFLGRTMLVNVSLTIVNIFNMSIANVTVSD